MGAHPIREEHCAELADDEVKAAILERQFLRIRSNEADLVRVEPFCGDIEHRLVEIGGDDFGIGQSGMNRFSHYAGARRSLESAKDEIRGRGAPALPHKGGRSAAP